MQNSDFTGRTYEPFAIQVGPEVLYIITAPKDVAEVYKKSETLGWNGHLNQIFLNFGFNADSLKLAWLKPVNADSRYKAVNPNQLSLIHLIESIYAKQLLPGAHMDELNKGFVSALQAALRLPNLNVCTVRAKTHSSTVSLLTLCQHTLLEAGLYSFFGKTIMETDKNIISNLLAFTENAWMLFYGLPSFWASAVLIPQNAVIATFKQFADLPESLRSDQSWSVQQILVAQECVGIDLRSRACMLLMILWA